jgi:hypothetical protein
MALTDERNSDLDSVATGLLSPGKPWGGNVEVLTKTQVSVNPKRKFLT